MSNYTKVKVIVQGPLAAGKSTLMRMIANSLNANPCIKLVSPVQVPDVADGAVENEHTIELILHPGWERFE